MLSLLENIENSVEPFFTFGSNALSHGRTFCYFSRRFFDFCSFRFFFSPSFIVPVITLAVGGCFRSRSKVVNLC